MIKGAQKRMIVVKTADSRMFEEAYFVMRGEVSIPEGDMVAEANRIIEDCQIKRAERAKRRSSAILIPICSFLGGNVLGILITLAVVLLSQ